MFDPNSYLFEKLQKMHEVSSQNIDEPEDDELYGIDVRNMHTALHSIIVFEDELPAIRCEKELAISNDAETLSDYIGDIVGVIERIDYKDIERTSEGKMYNNIHIINDISIDIYGL